MSTDALDRYLKKMGFAEPRIKPALKTRFAEPFPKTKSAQYEWCLRQFAAIKDLFLEEVDSPRNLQITSLTAYAATIVKIRDSIYIRDRGKRAQALSKSPEKGSERNPLKGMLSDDTLQEIEKARKLKNGQGETKQ